MDIVESPSGYRSLASRAEYLRLVGSLGVVFIVLQVVAPLVLGICFMPGMMANPTMMNQIAADHGAFWHGSAWVVEEPFGQTTGGGSTLQRVSVAADAEPVKVGQISDSRVWLLPTRDALWAVSPSLVSRYNEKSGLGPNLSSEVLGDISPPFLDADRPAVIEGRPDGMTLRVFSDKTWIRGATFELPHGGRVQDLRVVPCGGQLSVFFKDGNTVFVHQGLPASSKADWHPVCQVQREWTAVLLGDQPAVFAKNEMGNPSPVIGFRQTGDSWRQFVSLSSSPMGMAFGVYPMAKTANFIVVSSTFPGSYRIAEVHGQAVQFDKKYGGAFPGAMLPLMFAANGGMALVPLILAVVLAPLMAKHRLPTYVSSGVEMDFAPIWRRGVAQIIDGLILGGPVAWGYFHMFSNFDDMNPEVMLTGFGSMFGGFAWAGLVFFLFSYTEGKSGITPGKWLLGLRVLGTDLLPCGFGRALLRNVLLCADGFFIFLVGVLTSALTEKWQRIGDMAASTVVVMAPTSLQD